MFVATLQEGSFSIDASKKFIRFNPSEDIKADRKGATFVHIQPFLVATEKDLIILDTGLGSDNTTEKLLLHQNIRSFGYEPDDVTRVLMSHLHKDHTGGIFASEDELSFPNANYYVQENELEAGLIAEQSYDKPVLEALKRSKKLVLLKEESGAITDEISYKQTGGHTKYHQIFWINSQDRTVFFGGDVWPQPEQLTYNFIAKYDFDGATSKSLRTQYGTEAAKQHWTCLFYHAQTIPIGIVKHENGRFTVQPSSSLDSKYTSAILH